MDKKRSRLSWVLIYTLLFGLFCLLLYGPVFKNGLALVKSTDGIDQHLKALIFCGRWLRTAAKSLIPGSGVSFPGFSFVLGFGSDAAATLNYYALGDPLNLLAAFVSEEQCIWLYQALIILRLWLAGLSFCLFMQYMGRFRGSALLAGSLVYVFCGFAIFSSFRHPYFLNPMIYLPMILLGTERLFSEKKGGLLTLSVFISCVSNFYFFYMIVVMTVLYVGWRLIFGYGLKDKKRLLRLIGAETACSATGVLLAGFLFVPVLVLFRHNPRSSISHAVPLLYRPSYYPGVLMGSISSSRMTHWGFLGVTIFGLLGAGILMAKKGSARFRCAVIGVLLMLMIPAAGYVMNGFSYVSNRWCWGAALVFACCLVLAYEEITGMGRRVFLAGFVLAGGFLLTLTPLFRRVNSLQNREYKISVLVQCAALLGVLLVMLILGRLAFEQEKKRKIASLLVLAGIMICIAQNVIPRGLKAAKGEGLEKMENLSAGLSPEELESTEKTKLKKLRHSFWMTEGTVLSQLLTGEEAFFRYSGKESRRNNSVPASLPSTQYYWSLIDSRVSDFLMELGLNTDSSYAFKDLNARSLLSRLLSARYYVAEKGDMVPYGYSRLLGKEDPYGRVYQVFGCDQVLPFASAFDSVMSREDYEALPEIEKEEALLQGVVLSEIPEGFEESRPVFSEKELPVSLSAAKKEIEILPGELRLRKKGARLKIAVDTEPGMETSLFFKNFRLKIKNRDGREPEGDTDADRANFRCIMTIRGKSGKKTLVRSVFKFGALSNVWYSGRTNFLNCLGTRDQAMDSIELTFSTAGTVYYDDIKVYSRDLSGADGYVRSASDLTQEFDFHHDGYWATSLITGRIGVEKEKMILLSLPCFDSWTLYLDGEKTPLYQADTMLCAFPLSAGEHEVRLVYRPQGALAGLLSSLAGLLICLAVFLRKRRAAGRR